MADASPHWDLADWDQLTLGSTVLPGVWDIEGDASRRIDVKTRKGQDGAIIKDEGYQNAPITLVGQFSSQEHWAAMQKALKEIHPRRKGAARDPLALVHPAAAALGIDAVYVVSVGTPKRIGLGIVELRIECIEWIPKPKAVPKRIQAVAPPTFATFAQVRQQVRGSVYQLPSGNERTDTGFAPPSETVDIQAGLEALELNGG